VAFVNLNEQNTYQDGGQKKAKYGPLSTHSVSQLSPWQSLRPVRGRGEYVFGHFLCIVCVYDKQGTAAVIKKGAEGGAPNARLLIEHAVNVRVAYIIAH